MKYPVRCEIVDVDGQAWNGLPVRTPDKAKPHIGKQGTAIEWNGNVRINLDDGNVLFGEECWWKPIHT